MAYPHGKYQVLMTTSGVTCTTSGDKAEWYCGMVPHIIRYAGIIYSISGATPSGLDVIFNHISCASGSTASALDHIYGVSSDLVGNVVYSTPLNVVVSPGEKVVFNNSAIVSGVCNVIPFLWVEPKWETPANSTVMRVTT
jgi:hypothetical protein